MFTGIVIAVGQIVDITPRVPESAGLCLTVKAPQLDLTDVVVGDSIAHNGVCLTITSIEDSVYTVDVSPETLACSTGLAAVGEVNLEKALRLSDRLDGHLVSGHVDGVGQVVKVEYVGDNNVLAIRTPVSLSRYVAVKGSVTLDGVSLTVNSFEYEGDSRAGCVFKVHLIAHTLQSTTLHSLVEGSRVNIEVDLVARYLERLCQKQQYAK